MFHLYKYENVFKKIQFPLYLTLFKLQFGFSDIFFQFKTLFAKSQTEWIFIAQL